MSTIAVSAPRLELIEGKRTSVKMGSQSCDDRSSGIIACNDFSDCRPLAQRSAVLTPRSVSLISRSDSASPRIEMRRNLGSQVMQ